MKKNKYGNAIPILGKKTLTKSDYRQIHKTVEILQRFLFQRSKDNGGHTAGIFIDISGHYAIEQGTGLTEAWASFSLREHIANGTHGSSDCDLQKAILEWPLISEADFRRHLADEIRKKAKEVEHPREFLKRNRITNFLMNGMTDGDLILRINAIKAGDSPPLEKIDSIVKAILAHAKQYRGNKQAIAGLQASLTDAGFHHVAIQLQNLV